LLGTAAAITAAAFVLTVGPADAKAASSFQIPCFPYGTPNYAYGQYIGGWGYHVAEDVCHNDGIPVFAAADGVVKYSARTPDSYRWGNLIIIQHSWKSSSILSLYGHLNNDRRVGAGATVKKGQRIGTVGPRGSVNGNWDPHTHFGIRQATYKAGTGSYDHTIHGYEPSCCAGWVASGKYVNDRRSNYDYVGAAISGNRSMNSNGESVMTFKLWNTGRQTWLKGGSTPVRLGGNRPQDRGSGFSDGGTAEGWLTRNRIELLDDTPSGQLAQFRATFKSSGNPGTYPECFAPVVENLGWMRDLGLCATMTIKPPDWRGQHYGTYVTEPDSGPTDLDSTASPSGLLPGDRRSVKILVRNVGELQWNAGGANPVRLATRRPTDRTSAFRTIGAGDIDASENWPDKNRASAIDGRYDPGTDSVVADATITTGEIAVFSFVTTTPDKVGNIREYFSPVVEGKKHMSDTGSSVLFNILDRGYHYSYVSKSADPATITPGVTEQDVTVRLKNTGREAWPVDGNLRLGTDRARDHKSAFITTTGPDPWIARNRPSAVDSVVGAPGDTTVDPGQVAEFDFTITIPDSLGAGNYRLYVRPVMDGVGWLPEDYGINFPVPVAVARNLQFMKTVYSGNQQSFARNSTMTARVAIKNTGRLTWSASGTNPVRLATTHPQNRSSAFRTLTGGDPWLNANRASTIDGTVTDLSGNMTVNGADTMIEPGQIALFSVPLTAAPAPGTYREYFSLVQDGAAWFPDPGYNMLLKVVAP
jgi:murein DD-endopeptidase MepM/ murein hydrolase activator NlpD